MADDLAGKVLDKMQVPSTGSGFVDPSAFEGSTTFIHPSTRKAGAATAGLKWLVDA
jgi:hypothetical protein